MIGQTINNYIIETKIGDGGMGVVYYARHNRVDREVAIKVLHSNLFFNENIRNRFKNEANALIKLNHKNIVQIYDYVEQDDFACLIMEYINGYTLDEYITKISGPLPSAKATSIISFVLDAVQFAHDKNVYHRDIKPSNIMICKDGNIVKIMDFGIAKLTDSSNFNATKTNAQLGTPFYMSPEQVKGLPFTRLSDIYSLGVTLFEMVTGKCPYSEITNLFELQTKIINEVLPATNTYYPSVTSRIQKAIAIATNKNPEQRFKSCAEFKNFVLEVDDVPLTQPKPISQPKQQVVKVIPEKPIPVKPITKTKEPIKPKEPKKSKLWIYILSGFAVIIVIAIVVFLNNGSGGVTNNNTTDTTKANKTTSKDSINDKTSTLQKKPEVKKPDSSNIKKTSPSPPTIIITQLTEWEIKRDFKNNFCGKPDGHRIETIPYTDENQLSVEIDSSFIVDNNNPPPNLPITVNYTIFSKDKTTNQSGQSILHYSLNNEKNKYIFIN